MPEAGPAPLDIVDGDAVICPPGQGCPCQVDSDCPSGMCLTLPDGTKECARPCEDTCPEGWEMHTKMVDNTKYAPEGKEAPKKIEVCFCAPQAIEPCLTSPEICDGEDNDCDGETDEDLCDDGNPCTANTCDPSLATDLADGCTTTNLTIACEDGDLCTVGEHCAGGNCPTGSPKDCDDSEVCTTDSCDQETGGCVHTPAPGPCDDGTVCTVGDACSDQGVCVPGPVTSCDDNNVCTTDSCDPLTGCLAVNNEEGCDDGNACTVKDVCVQGACESGAETECDDGNPCTLNVCDPALVTALADGCTLTNVTGPCSDEEACTKGDTCVDGACKPGPTLDCDDDNPCTVDSCVKETGICAHVAKKEGSACDDGDICTLQDTCDAKATCGGEAKGCDDGKDCTIDICDKNTGLCVYENNSGASCEDGNGCTLGDACLGGNCVSGKLKLCDDSKPCTDNGCDPKTGACVFKPNTVPCEDGNPCTQKDKCALGSCVGGDLLNCDDGNVCTKEACDSATGKCAIQLVPDNVLCSDADLCTEGDACKKGVCTSGPPKYCDDDDVCTDDGCDAKLGKCTTTLNKAPCDDGNKCTEGDTCAAGKCASGENKCECQSNAECQPKEDGDPCNGTLFCDLASNTCKVDTNTVVICDSSKNTTCSVWACDVKTGICVAKPAVDGKPCDADKSVCTVGDKCTTGVCIKGASLKCDDSDVCTNDVCDPIEGCKHTFNTAPCADGSLCTLGDQCKEGQCVAGALKDCDDKDPCTTDGCDKSSGSCTFEAASGMKCDDANKCSLGDLCVKGACVAQSVVKCKDDNPCTLDACDPKTGKCTYKPAFDGLGCEDGKKCTNGDACKGGKCVSGSVLNCWDGSPCTKDSCDAGTGNCKHEPANEGLTCNDGDACTLSDVCVKGECKPKDETPCDDKNKCTIDTCNKITGVCEYKPIVNGTPCDDGNLCTSGDACQQGKCQAAKTVECKDGKFCTDDGCDKKTGKCWFKNNSRWCNDGNLCTGWDRCKAGVCAGKAKSCSDNNVCTLDSCDPLKGCQHKQRGDVGCNDGNACTTGDTCKSGTCKGVGKVCNDHNVCTNDTCNIKSGCKFVFNSNACNDGNKCTSNDKCAGGSCSAGVPASCSDGNACTLDKCDTVKGCLHSVNDKASCSDNNKCSVGDHCKGGKCLGGPALNCDDTNPCTKDTCSANAGCKHAIIDNEPCDDGSLCTPVEKCVVGVCTAAGVLDCDDNNPCTIDGCNATKGCVHTPSAASCDDGDACTDKDACKQGKCVGGEKLTCDDDNLCTDDTCDLKSGCVHVEAQATSVAKMGVHSDIQVETWTDFKQEGGEEVPVGIKPAVPAWDGHPSWKASIPGAVWIWRTAKVLEPTKATKVFFHRSFTVPSSAKKVGGTLRVAADDGYFCMFNDQEVAKVAAASAGSVKLVSVDGIAKVGVNHFFCEVHNPGVPGATAETNPAGLLFSLDLSFEVDKQTCDDGNACTSLDLCEKGQCTGQNGLNCNDGNLCTLDSCSPKTGCVQVGQSNVPCNDGNACTVGDACELGVCKNGKLTDCNDDNACTIGSCDALKGCSFVDKKSGKPLTMTFVSDAKTLATDTMKIVNGEPVFVGLKPAVAAWSGNPEWVKIPGSTWIWMTEKVANPTQTSEGHFWRNFEIPVNAEGASGLMKVSADDYFECFINGIFVGGTDPEDASWKKLYELEISGAVKPGKNTLGCRVTNLGEAGMTWKTGPAGLIFKVDLWWYKKGESLQCDDGNACSMGDHCVDGSCMTGPPLICFDENPCTLDSCDPKGAGCVFEKLSKGVCNDGTICTQKDTCKEGKCVGEDPLSCDDGNSCTKQGCDPLFGCDGQPVAKGTPCEDGDVCSVSSICDKGVCVLAKAKLCTDNNPCTQDNCVSGTGCKFAPVDGGGCDDDDTCTVGDVCANGLCLGKKGASCDDANTCTLDKCDPKLGCIHDKSSGGICEDGDACTIKDICDIGVCKSGETLQCIDSQQCTVDGCDPKTGKCVFSPISDGECDDGNLCSLNDGCVAGKCVAGPPPPCGDGNPCTTDGCDPKTGKCLHAQVQSGSACDDGNKCTTTSKCLGLDCVGAAKDCSDDESCTLDVCDPATGACDHQPLKDGLPCEKKAGLMGLCAKGVCS